MSTELASSLAQEDIPIKLRCATCNKLVVNAFRLPCCDQSICEHCQADLPESCPVCDHSPLSAEDCKPNKALRLTVKAFLKNEEKKRDKDRGVPVSQAQNPALVTFSSSATSTPLPEFQVVLEPRPGDDEIPALTEDGDTIGLENTEIQRRKDVGEAIDDNPENEALNNEAVETRPRLEGATLDSTAGGDDLKMATPQSPDAHLQNGKEESSWGQQQGLAGQAFGDGFGMNGMNFSNSNWNGASNINPMMAMQSGLQPGLWSGFPNMMGLPGMGMDPMMMSQGMFGGFNGQGMGMNGMNGIGMGVGFDGMYGWNGQSGMGMQGMNGDFGANSGYYSGGGYNHQAQQRHFNGMPHQQFSMNNYQQNRSRGQGYAQRGFGRDQGYHAGRGQHAPPRNADNLKGIEAGNGELSQAPINGEIRDPNIPPQPSEDGGQSVEIPSVENQKEPNQGADDVPEDGVCASESHAVDQPESIADPAISTQPSDARTVTVTDEPVIQAIKTVESSEHLNEEVDISPVNVEPTIGPNVPRGPAAQYSSSQGFDIVGRGIGGPRGFGRAGHGFRGGFRGRDAVNGGIIPFNPPTAPKGHGVAGAPTGPKAMRAGLPNVSFRGRGNARAVGRGGFGDIRPTIPKLSSALDSKRSRSRTRSRSPSKDRRRRHRNRSKSASGDEGSDASARRHQSKHHRPRKDGEENAKDESHRVTRDASPYRTSKHRGRHERDRHSTRRDRSREDRRHRHRSSRSGLDDSALDPGSGSEVHTSESGRHRHGKDSGRSHQHRDDHRPRESDRKRSRRGHSGTSEADRSGSNGHHTDRAGLEIPAPREFKIKDRSKRHESDAPTETVTEEKPIMDSHAMEREARNRERQVKEQQRRQLMYTEPTKKRARDDAAAAPISSSSVAAVEAGATSDQRGGSKRKLRHDFEEAKSGRRASYKYEDEENDEARAVRVENEREAARWN